MINPTLSNIIIHIRHSVRLRMALCLFALCLLIGVSAGGQKRSSTTDTRIHLVHSDQLSYDMYGPNPDAQIVKGNVIFTHQGARLTCDSAYFYQSTNSMKAFGRVRFTQGDTLSLTCDRADYDGQQQVMRARKNVVLRHRRQTLRTDSLDYDRLYKNAYFFEGGTLVDGNDKLVSDWGEYNTETRKAVFYYHVKLRSPDRIVTTDTLHYDTRTSVAHVTGPSKIIRGKTTVNTSQGYFNTASDKAELFGRSTIDDGEKSITGDSLYYDSKTGNSSGHGNVLFKDRKNKNELAGNYLWYDEKKGIGFVTDRALVTDYSQKDTLYMHADTIRLKTFHIDTDSMYRDVYAFHKVRMYRKDMQAVCDSLVFSTKDSSLVMYQKPVVWNINRQLTGDSIRVFMNDSTIREAHVLGQALSAEQLVEPGRFNQIASRELHAYFNDGNLRKTIATGNVATVFYPRDDQDSTLLLMNYMETDTLKMTFNPQRQLQRIWAPKSVGTSYPMTQIPNGKETLRNFVWYETARPMDKHDVFNWRPIESQTPETPTRQRLTHDKPVAESRKETSP